jgi:hypothetical protein
LLGCCSEDICNPAMMHALKEQKRERISSAISPDIYSSRYFLKRIKILIRV